MTQQKQEKEKKIDEISELARRRGLFFPAFEMYGGASGFYDYGPAGTLIKNNIENRWRESFVIGEELLEISSPIIGIEEVFMASGHAMHFSDPITRCKKCGDGFRADHLIEEVLKEAGRGASVLTYEEMEKVIRENKVRCPACGGELGEIRKFNLMFKTSVGIAEKKSYLRPETAQNIFILFSRLYEVNRKKLPLGVAQIGRAYRNEISPRQGLIRLREFSQAEIEYFVDPEEKKHARFNETADVEMRLVKEDKEEIKINAKQAVEKGIIAHELLAYFLIRTQQFLEKVGIPRENIRFRQHTKHERAHYAIDCWDAEILTKRFSWIEVVGIADRTDYDLSAHAKASGENLTAFEKERHVVPHVIEPSFGIDRIFYCVVENAYSEKEDKGEKKTVLKLKPSIAPYAVAVFPLLNKEPLLKKAQELFSLLKSKKIYCTYDASGSIGRRYARADEIGIPFALTIDFQTLEDSTITIRERDSAAQKRIRAEEAPEMLLKLAREELSFSEL